jgi:glycosyltransferase involved in cell wall biosynthesis
VLGETRAGTQFEFAHRLDEAGFDFAFENEIVGDNRTGLNDAIGGDADAAGSLERAAPAVLNGVIGEVERSATFVAVGLRDAAVELEPVTALVALNELLRWDGTLPDLRAELGAESRARVLSAFSWRRAAEEYVQLLGA